MINIQEKGLTYDDVLLIPKYSEIEHRANIDLSVDLGKGIKLGLPFVSANMKTVSEYKLTSALANLGGIGILHRFYQSSTDRFNDYKTARFLANEYRDNIAISVGISESEKEIVRQYADLGGKIICLDIANLNNLYAYKMAEWIAAQFPALYLIAGNICTADAIAYCANSGIDCVKVGIGAASVCSTRTQTGNGFPQLSALSNIFDTVQNLKPELKIIADGGIKNSGDIAKALCFADLVMVGRLFAGTTESPSELIEIKGKFYKRHEGSSTYKKRNVEGVKGLTPYVGDLKNVVEQLADGIRSACSYQGVSNLNDLKINPQFVQLTQNGVIESYPHNLRFEK